MFKNFKNKHVYISTILYLLTFYYAYTDFLSPSFDYIGFEYNDKGFFEVLFAFLIVFIPCLFYKEGKISSFIAIFIYVLLYIPIIFCFTFIPKEITFNNYEVQFSIFIGMNLLFIVERFKIQNTIRLNSLLFSPRFILFLTFLFSGLIMVIFRDNLKIVSFEDVYDLRENSTKVSGNNIFIDYISLWMLNFFMPACYAYGILYKKKIYIIAGSLIAVVLYAAVAAKIAILFPLVYLFFAYLNRKDKLKNFYTLLVYSISGLIIFSITLLNIFPKNANIFMLNSVLLARTVANGGMLTYWYFQFFQDHPYTYYSHINIVNAITHTYPYDDSLGNVVGGNFWAVKMNANANLWATDGIAAAGVMGILFVNLILSYVLYILNYATANNNKLFVILLFLPFISMFLNTSIFTSLLSRGVFLSVLFLLNLKKNI